eukprot:CAMPEP_0119289212 /NCGR_PEP_ID=MMETSP1329-20130426/38651_1 /TAXON_ID=114041 /ORGANISM="Genus nov. species nov., Strain RCC1024" /LENGTH=188 /DNA_ID=CAMNT_0007290007 /DNA_START=69 /DNA_END=631 /DNA_ORIENTATION=-
MKRDIEDINKALADARAKVDAAQKALNEAPEGPERDAAREQVREAYEALAPLQSKHAPVLTQGVPDELREKDLPDLTRMGKGGEYDRVDAETESEDGDMSDGPEAFDVEAHELAVASTKGLPEGWKMRQRSGAGGRWECESPQGKRFPSLNKAWEEVERLGGVISVSDAPDTAVITQSREPPKRRSVR